VRNLLNEHGPALSLFIVPGGIGNMLKNSLSILRLLSSHHAIAADLRFSKHFLVENAVTWLGVIVALKRQLVVAYRRPSNTASKFQMKGYLEGTNHSVIKYMTQLRPRARFLVLVPHFVS
jgi:hypothetical protein